MRRDELIACGYSITAQQSRVSRDPPPTVRLFKMGGADAHYMTPSEARSLADALMKMASYAEGEP